MFLTLLMSLLLALPGGGMENPVTEKKSIEVIQNEAETADSIVEISFILNIRRGWHVYSVNMPADGPVGASLTLDSQSGLAPMGDLTFDGREIEKDDPVFGMKVRFFENSVTFSRRYAVTDASWTIAGYMTYASCNDESCIPPKNIEFEYSGKAVRNSASEADADGADSLSETEEGVSAGAGTVVGLEQIPGYDAGLWEPADYERDETAGQGKGLWGLLLTSFLGGLLALLTPCVWPVIPMTVSFFLKRSENRKSAVRDALLYGVSIVVVYVALGLLITLIFGASALNSLATNAVVNLIFFAVLVIFALSFFGLFEITLPSGWSTGLSKKSSSSGGFIGIFLMALTLSIVSFSCTGPIIGFLLVDAASTGGIAAPTLGMFGFSLALAIPFALFAMFPHWLKSMPKSGGWMDKVKVTLGFVELAFSLKFLSVADMAYGWGILPRDLFVLLWILMAVVLGLYLLGVVRFHKWEEKSKPSWLAVGVAVISLAFAAWMVPGLWGSPLKAISAFTPPMATQHINVSKIQVEPDCTDYNEGIRLSKETGKPILLDFTGYGCVNCRKMEASVWTDPNVASLIRDKYVLVSLFVDDKTALDKVTTISENGTTVKIRTVGDKWSLLQRYKFGANAQPFYVIIDASGRMIAGPYVFDPDIAHFTSFLGD